MADLIQSVQDMLKEETWTRTTISNWNNLKDLSAIIEKARSENCVKEVHAICEEHLSHSKDSIIALYICGILDLQKGTLDNSSLVTLVDIFLKNHKENIVISLCESILADDENNKFALRTLAECYLSEDKTDKVWELYTKLVKIDFEEAVLARKLAEHYEEEYWKIKKEENASDGAEDSKEALKFKEPAIEYYKKAILRFINQNNYNACKEIWGKLVQLCPGDFDFFQLLRRKIAKIMGEHKTPTLMVDIFRYYTKEKDWDKAIFIIKQNLEVEPKDASAITDLKNCYREKYKERADIEKFISSSFLSNRNVFEAINDFEKHIAFDEGKYVFHRNWGVGKILKIKNDTLYIVFSIGGKRTMQLSMAVTALKPLSENHIWVQKVNDEKGELPAKFRIDRKNPAYKEKLIESLKTVILSFDNNCDLKRIKAELVPSILTAGEWTSWSAEAKKILESEPIFGVNPNDINMYMVREKPITTEEKLSNEFKAQKQFFARVDILMKYVASTDTDISSDLFAEMYSYFTGYLKNISKVNEYVIASYLVVKNLSARDRQLAYPVKETFAEIYGRLEDPRAIYNLLKDTKNTSLRADFIKAIKLLPDWNEQYIKLFPTVLSDELLNDLIDEGFTGDVQKLVKTAFEQYKDYRETVIFFFKECQDKEWYKEVNISYEKQLITLINIIELTFREINNHVNTTENKKINKNATTLLFEEESLFTHMFSKDEDTVKKMYTLIDDIADMDPSYKALARNKILEKYPEFKFRVSEEKSSQPKGMIVTSKKLKEKKEELDNLQNVLLPANAQDIAEAKARGDLKENAEYKAAREEQHRLSLRLATLQAELNRAVVFDPTTSTNSVVSFATVVTLTNNDDGKDEKFTILGPWESDPDNNIISYMSPFGNAIMDKKVGTSVKFTINDRNFSYTIKEIKKANNY